MPQTTHKLRVVILLPRPVRRSPRNNPQNAIFRFVCSSTDLRTYRKKDLFRYSTINCRFFPFDSLSIIWTNNIDYSYSLMYKYIV